MSWIPVILVFCTVFSTGIDARDFRWCTVNNDENTKCQAFVTALPGIARIAGVNITAACVSGSTDEDCMKKIKNNMADLITLDGGKIYEAGKEYELVPIVAENYGPSEGVKYYAVAVARKETDVKLNNLKGKKSCHTGYRRTAGWNIPMGFLLESQMEKKGCDAQSASAFFKESCVPGVPKGFPNLCTLCPEGSDCSGDSQKNKYSGYHGSFKCMADKKGDVGFVKHLTTGEVVAEGGYGSISDYKYLCTNGEYKEVTNTSHLNCNLGRNPSHAVMTRAGDNKDFVSVLITASKYCQSKMPDYNCSGFDIFNSAKYVAGKKDLLFKDSTIKLVDVGIKNTYKLWLGDGYSKAIEALGDKACPNPKPRGTTTTLNPLPILLLVLVALRTIV